MLGYSYISIFSSSQPIKVSKIQWMCGIREYFLDFILHKYLSFNICPGPIEIKFFRKCLTNISFFNRIEPFLKYLSISNR